VAPLAPTVEVRLSRGRGRVGGLGAPGIAHGGSGKCGEHDHGHSTGAGALEGGGSRRGSSAAAAAQLYFGEQSRTTEARQGKNRGGIRLVTSGEGSGILGRRTRHGGVTGRRRRSCCSVKKTPVSTDRANRGKGSKRGGVSRCWRGGGAHRGNGRDRSSTAAAERTMAELHECACVARERCEGGLLGSN
jgi:hypothetical protein